ncbi:MAG: mandelate racemase/muconate lactonizing enzyme family protein [Bryobacteraceae bacterium]|jgi:L-alanine-DL-glutamate epimerase-like enolase superfamily enzyme
MRSISRRSLLGSVPVAAATALSAADRKAPAKAMKLAGRVHPLDGIARENIKITDLKVTLLSAEIPKDRQWYNPRTIVWKSDAVLVEVFTDKGIVGIGEGSPYGGPVDMKKYAEDFVKPILIGQNPFDVELLGGTPASVPVMSGARVWAGVDCALWDIVGKAKGLSVYKLLATEGEPAPHIKLYASGGDEWAFYKHPENLIGEALRVKEQGYTAFKFRLGPDWKLQQGATMHNYIPMLRKLREAVGPDFNLIQEANMRLSLEEALELAPVLEELRFLWFEEPVRVNGPEAIDNYNKIRGRMPHVMVSGGESRPNRFDFKDWIERGAYDIVQPDCNVTGVTEAWNIARVAHLRKKYCCPHDWHGGLTIMANAALVAAIPNHLVLEHNVTFSYLREGVFKEPLLARHGYIDLPDKPGFGVEVIPDIEKKFPYLPGSFDKPNPDLPA